MKTAVINIKTDPKLKAQAREVAADLGFSLSAVINAYLRQLTRTKTVTFSAADEVPSEYLVQALKESEEDRLAGRYYSFDNREEAIAFLNKVITQKDEG